MVYPEFIKEQDILAVTAPSDGVVGDIDTCRLDYAIKNFKKKNFVVVETENVRHSVLGRSASGEKRAEELQKLVKNDQVKMIFCAAGGDFLFEMLSFVDFDLISKNPKWLQGYSDMTGLIFPLTTGYDIATIYGNNFKAFGMSSWHVSLENNLELLKGNLVEQDSFDQYEKNSLKYINGDEGYHLDSAVYWNIITSHPEVLVKGRIIGGCIDVLSDLFGTRFDYTKKFVEKYRNDGIIWYFDQAELSNEQLVRTLWKFKDSGWFLYTKCILFGRIYTDHSYYGISFIDAIKSVLGDLNIPIVTDCCFGHVAPRMTIVNGSVASIKVVDGHGSIQYDFC